MFLIGLSPRPNLFSLHGPLRLSLFGVHWSCRLSLFSLAIEAKLVQCGFGH